MCIPFAGQDPAKIGVSATVGVGAMRPEELFRVSAAAAAAAEGVGPLYGRAAVSSTETPPKPPSFLLEPNSTTSLVTSAGQTAYLHCLVRNLGDRSVSFADALWNLRARSIVRHKSVGARKKRKKLWQ